MTTADLIIGLFAHVDNEMTAVPKHPQAELYPSEMVTLALLYALKGGGKRAFYRWLVRDWLAFFPRLPHRTRLFRLFTTHRAWADRFHAEEGDPANLKICPPKQWNSRMVIETVYSMLTTICRFKHMTHRVWEYFQAHLAFAVALFNILVQWHGFQPNEEGFFELSIAEFSL